MGSVVGRMRKRKRCLGEVRVLRREEYQGLELNGRAPGRVEKGSGVIFRLHSTSRPEGRRTGGLRRAGPYQGRSSA